MKTRLTTAPASLLRIGKDRPAVPITSRFISVLTALLFSAGLAVTTHAQRVRNEVSFPDLPGYVTLRCEFHMHTVFSDGNVWPTIRVDEAWREGYDAIAITDHLEYLPHRQDMVWTNFNRSYELARPMAQSLGLLLIQSAELTRGEPPGHWNLLFLTNANAIPTNDHRAALRAAREQGAFVFWNHPGWKQPNWQSKWYDEQQDAFTNGWLHGIEIVNGPDYDPIAHQWCLDKRLTMLGNSDAHGVAATEYGIPPGNRRPTTLVFAKEKSVSAIHEALLGRRTAVYAQNMIYGDEQYLQPLFDRSVVVETPKLTMAAKGRAVMQIHNRSAVDFELKANAKVMGITFPQKVTLYAGKTVAMDVGCTAEPPESGSSIHLPYEVGNLKTAPKKSLSVLIPFTFVARQK